MNEKREVGKRNNPGENPLDQASRFVAAQAYLDCQKRFMNGNALANTIGVELSFLDELANKDAFKLGRIGNSVIVDMKSFHDFLDQGSAEEQLSGKTINEYKERLSVSEERSVNHLEEQSVEEKSLSHLDDEKSFVSGEMLAERVGVTIKTLHILGESGEFELGRIAGKTVIYLPSFLEYLDRNHFTGRTSDDQPIVFDSKGRVNEKLTLVGEKHTEVPYLYPIKDYAARLDIEPRSFTRHCEIGTFSHYRIGSIYKMSEEDWVRGLRRITETRMKGARGRRKKNSDA